MIKAATPKLIGLIFGILALVASIVFPTPAGMSREAFVVAGLVVLMAAWWMTEALPLTATALMPFLVLPFAGVMDAKATASAYYSPILFLILGGAFIALAIERTGLHRRLALFLLRLVGKGGGQTGVLIAFMATAAILSMLISNTSTTLIMMPMALAVLRGGGSSDDQFEGLAGALPMGIAFAASIGGLGTLVGWLAHQRHCGWPAGYTGGHADYLCKMGALWPACGHHRRAAGGVDREPGPERLALFVRYCRRPHLD